MMIFVLQDGVSSLMTASNKGHLDVVKTLIEAGANVNHTDKVGKYLHCCCTCTCTHVPLVLYTHVYMYVIMMPWVQMQVFYMHM